MNIFNLCYCFILICVIVLYNKTITQIKNIMKNNNQKWAEPLEEFGDASKTLAPRITPIIASLNKKKNKNKKIKK